MPRAITPLPPITAVPRDLTVDDVREIIEIAERAQARRAELTREMRAALASGDQTRVNEIARAMVTLEEAEQET